MKRCLLTSCLALALLAGCHKSATIHLSCDVTDQDGNPVDAAEIRFQSRVIGIANKSGHADIRLQIDPQKTIILNVTKKDDERYYDETSIEISAQSSQRFEVVKKVQLHSAPRTFAQSNDDSQEEEDTEAEAENTLPPPQPTSPSKAPALIAPPTEAVVFTTPVVSADDKSTPSTVNLLVRSRGNWLKGATAYRLNRKNQMYEKACEANDRGRCSLLLKENDLPASLLIRQNGYVTKTVSLDKLSTQYIELDAGTSLDIFTIETSWNGDHGLGGVSVYIGARELGVTDENGFLSIPISEKDSDAVVLHSPAHLPARISIEHGVRPLSTVVKRFVSTNVAIPWRYSAAIITSESSISSTAAIGKAHIERSLKSSITEFEKMRPDMKWIESAESHPHAVMVRLLGTPIDDRHWHIDIEATNPMSRTKAIEPVEIYEADNEISTEKTLSRALDKLVATIIPPTILSRDGRSVNQGQISLGKANSSVKTGDRFIILSPSPMNGGSILQDRITGEALVTQVGLKESSVEITGQDLESIKESSILIYKQGDALSWQPIHRLKNQKM